MNAAGDHWRIHPIRSLSARYADSWSAWLHPREMAYWRSCTSAERRASWCWGRVAAKSLLLAQPSLPIAEPRDLCIHSRSDNGALGTPPRVTLGGDELPVFLSITHTRQRVAVAISRTPIGIDVVEEDEAQSPALKSWLTTNEHAGNISKSSIGESFSLETEHQTAECWAAKEAAFKTLPFGTPFQPHRIRLEQIIPGRMRWRLSDNPIEVGGEVRLRRGPGFVLAVARPSASQVFPVTTTA